MKYLFLIIRHMFPRSRWRIIRESYVGLKDNGRFDQKIYTLQNQFGEIKFTTLNPDRLT